MGAEPPRRVDFVCFLCFLVFCGFLLRRLVWAIYYTGAKELPFKSIALVASKMPVVVLENGVSAAHA